MVFYHRNNIFATFSYVQVMTADFTMAQIDHWLNIKTEVANYPHILFAKASMESECKACHGCATGNIDSASTLGWESPWEGKHAKFLTTDLCLNGDTPFHLLLKQMWLSASQTWHGRKGTPKNKTIYWDKYMYSGNIDARYYITMYTTLNDTVPPLNNQGTGVKVKGQLVQIGQ